MVSGPTLTMLDKWQNSAENLIAHFAVVCQGQHPFTLSWLAGDTSAAAGLDPTSTGYMVDLMNNLSSIKCVSVIYRVR